MAADSPNPQNTGPTGRLRLAAALGGAGVLAVGLGSGVLQADGQEVARSGAPGESALGTAQQPAPTTASAADDAPNPNVSSTPLDPPSPNGSATSESSADPTPPPESDQASEPTATAPAPTTPAAPAAPAPPAAAPAAQPAAPATPAAPADPAATGTTPAAPPAADAATEPEEPAEVCEPGEEEALTLQGDDDEISCVPTEDEHDEDGTTRRPKRKAARTTTRPAQPPLRNAEGVPTVTNPTTSIALPGAAPIGVPNFFIDKFRIPPFLLSIYQAAGVEYGIRWEILAAINEIETDYGRNLNVSSAGALGWMQFMPATWKQYGVDANGDGRKDPYNPVDAIFAAARYLKAAGGEQDLRRAIFAYNHADWYVDSVLMRARLVGGLPVDLVGSLTGLTQGRFPVAAKARYADDLDERKAARRMRAGENASVAVDSDSTRRGVLVFAKAGSPAVATHDGTIVKRGTDDRLGRFVQIRDVHGNTYTYGRLARLESRHPVAKRGAKPTRVKPVEADGVAVEPKVGEVGGKTRLFAHPDRPKSNKAGGATQIELAGGSAVQGRDAYVRDLLDLGPGQVTWKQLKPGTRVVAGTILGRLGRTSSTRAPHTLFEIRPAGRGAPRIDPKPILDGWKLLESTAIYRSKSKNPFHGDDADAPTIGQILLMSKEALQQRVLKNPRIEIHGDGRLDIRSGLVDRRVLATLEFLAANGLKPTVSSLYRSGSITVSGNVSHHATGTAVDISAINGTPVIGHQGNGSITDITIRRLLNLQGVMKPDQIISLMEYPSADNTLAMGDHADHIHVGYRPVSGDTRHGSVLNATLKPGQWFKVIDRLSEIENPVVRTTPSKASIKVKSVKPNARARSRAARSAGSSR
jgi:murein DD-endopeptidase MepM/ murein hydrolase activator NlpD